METARLPERLIFGHRRAILILFAFATLFLAFQAYHLKPDASFAKLLPQGHPFIARMNAHMEDLQAAGRYGAVSLRNLAGGTLSEGRTEYMVRTLNEYVGLEQVASTIVARKDDGIP